MNLESLSVEAPAQSHGNAGRARVRSLLKAADGSVQRFRSHWGQAALLHLPAVELVERALLRFGHVATRLASNGRGSANQALLMLRAFRDMEIDFITAGNGLAVIGRGLDARVRMNDASVSKHHANLSWSQSGIFLSDLGSLNGTELNGVPVNGPVKLEDGDQIALGDANLVFVTSHTLFLQLESVRHSEHGAH